MSSRQSSPEGGSHSSSGVDIDQAGAHPQVTDPATDHATDHAAAEETTLDAQAEGHLDNPSRPHLDGSASYLQSYYQSHPFCDDKNCNHGGPSPQPRPVSVDSEHSVGGPCEGGNGDDEEGDLKGTVRSHARTVFGDAIADRIVGKTSTTQKLAKRHGVKHPTTMYIAYYFPFLRWVDQYKWSYLKGDLVAAITMASFYIPMSLSYASNLAHIPPMNGLYAFAVNPLIYAFLGSCPQMVVGPEAAGSLLLGSVIRTSAEPDANGDVDPYLTAQIAGTVTGLAGAIIFIAGLTRLGFLDNVLSRPFMRGFICAMGVIILINQLIPEMGLNDRAKQVGGVSRGSSLDKLVFLVTNVRYAHGLTCAVAFTSFAIIMICRELKKHLQPRYPPVAYVPDRFLVVFLSAVFTWQFGWDKKGLDILGDVQSGSGSAFPFRIPVPPSNMTHVGEAIGTSFLIALLGFFESSVAAKSLGGGEGKNGEGVKGMSVSANRELVALGVANAVGGCFMALPAFGGYGRSKVNAATGGKTPASSIFLSLITILCVFVLVPYFYYLPKPVLSAMVSVVAYSLVEEAPKDIRFFIRIRGASELALMLLVFVATLLYSLSLGVALGAGFSILSLIKHSTKPRIQILGRVLGTDDNFENAEDDPHRVEFIEGCLIVKMPEPLIFANTGDLSNRLRRLELYGTGAAHPALPRVRSAEHNRNIIFDVHGVTEIDGSGVQVLTEIVSGYVDKGVRVFFARLPIERSSVYQKLDRSGLIAKCGGLAHFTSSVEDALKLVETENINEYYRDHPNGGDV